MVKETFKSEILRVLKGARYGLSVSKIAAELNASRTTVSKYLKILKNENKTLVQDIGQYKLWHLKERYERSKSRLESLSVFYEPFYMSLMDNLPKFIVDSNKLKELGKKIAKDLIFSEMTDLVVSEESEKSPINHNFPADPIGLPQKLIQNVFSLQEIAGIIMNIIDSILTKFDSYQWATPIIFEDQGFLMLRMVDSDYIKVPGHFYIFSGIIEEEMSKYIPVRVNVHQIPSDDKIVDIKFVF